MFLINTPRLAIRPLEPADFHDVYSLLSDPKVMQFIGNGKKTEDEARILFNKLIHHQETFGFSSGKITEIDSGKFVGCGGLFHLALDHANPDIEVSYFLRTAFWCKGYAKEIAKNCLDWGFKNLDLKKIVGVTHPNNISSQHVLQKVGMIPKGESIYLNQPVYFFERKAPEAIEIHQSPPTDFNPHVEIAACYILAKNEILLLKCALGKSEEGLWGVPAGKIDSSETPFEGVQRELQEETTLQFNPSLFINRGKLYIRKTNGDYIYYMYLVQLDSKPTVTISEEHQAFC